MSIQGQKTAVVLLNLGGPDSLLAVRPFLFNLFFDPAIISVPTPLRWVIAQIISRRRAPVAEKIYALMGGRSPLVPNTEAQAAALEAKLGQGFKTFIAMRYWHPRANRTVQEVAAWQPDRILLLPLYPQYSVTTSGSSSQEWQVQAAKFGLAAPTKTVCCWPQQSGFVQATVERVRQGLSDIKELSDIEPRVLFTAHGLPEQIVASGDPYQWQVEQSVQKIVEALAIPRLEYRLAYQSRVGPMKWIGPSTDTEVEQAGRDGKPLVVVPVAFVSEHSETLVELDIEYRHLADRSGVPAYVRTPTVDCLDGFIDGLAMTVRDAVEQTDAICSNEKKRLCPQSFIRCAMAI